MSMREGDRRIARGTKYSKMYTARALKYVRSLGPSVVSAALNEKAVACALGPTYAAASQDLT